MFFKQGQYKLRRILQQPETICKGLQRLGEAPTVSASKQRSAVLASAGIAVSTFIVTKASPAGTHTTLPLASGPISQQSGIPISQNVLDS